MNVYGWLFVGFCIFYFFFLKGELKAKINNYGIIIGISSVVLSVLLFLYDIIFNVILGSGGKGNLTGIIAALFGCGLFLYLFCFIMNAPSRNYWENRDDSKDVSKIRKFYGTCVYCKKKVSKIALKCPYCLSDLT